MSIVAFVDTSANYEELFGGGSAMNEGSRAHRLIMRGGATAAGGLVIRLGARLLFLFLAARLFGATALGAYSLAVAVVELAVAIGGFGMKRYLFKLFEDRGAREPGHVLLDATLLVLPTSLALGAAIVVFTLVGAVGMLADKTAFALQFIAPMVAGQALLDLCLAVTRWRQKMRYEVVARSVIEPCVGTASMFAAYSVGFSDTGLLIGYTAGTLAALTYAAFGARKCLGKIHLSSYWPSLTGLFGIIRASTPPTVTDALAALFTRIDLYLVGAMLGEAAAGVYAIARQLKMPIRQVRQAFDSLLTPIVAKTLHKDGAQSTSVAIATAARLILALQLPLLLALAFIGQPILEWFGTGFGSAYVALLLLAAAETIQGSYSVTDLLLLYLRARLALVVTGSMILVYMAIAVPLVSLNGLDGAAVAMLVAIGFGTVLRRLMLKSHFAVSTPLLHSAGPLISASVAAVVAIVLSRSIESGSPFTHYLAALILILSIYVAAIMVWQRVSGDSLQLTGFRTA